MAQPTRCDGQVVCRRLSRTTQGENNGEEGCQGRKEKGREEAVILPKAFRGATSGHPIFFTRFHIQRRALSLISFLKEGPRSERANTTGRRARRQSAPRLDARHSHIHASERGDYEMAKKAKGGKKKAAKKR